MKSTFSKSWVRSTQPRKQRKYRYNAPLHLRRSMVSAHLQKSLRREMGKRSVQLRKGDEVQVVRGDFRGRRGPVTAVDLKFMKVYVENVKRKKTTGQEVQVPIDPSNVVVVKLNMDDRKRKKIFSRTERKEKQ